MVWVASGALTSSFGPEKESRDDDAEAPGTPRPPAP
eukprot:CAMPEP_0201277264 /NCGR_PEP_ID=MMETSP0853-20130426/59070_1 /ASSEMBLY_ACC=CAM_ASM_000640 /TAXON_ID=183588 /ORGANISM="Pseudo-nitzschia fraudulenta, Strain WWA7" /LENGTH=35 /DNA_ID= /DNA_START= /DNA_END= /DNA_ORIENTATION=